MFTFRPIGYVRSPYSDTSQVPKGPGTKHQAEGTLEIAEEFEEGLLDIEGFSHVFDFHYASGCSPALSLRRRPQAILDKTLFGE